MTRPFDFDTPLRLASKDDTPDGEAGIIAKTKPRTQKPPLYKVLLLNDDYTPMEFVVHVLERFFGMSTRRPSSDARGAQEGRGGVGVFSATRWPRRRWRR